MKLYFFGGFNEGFKNKVMRSDFLWVFGLMLKDLR
jgi:hypothetical protein